MAASRSPDRERPIGVFDSGVGGLTVLHELLVALPGEDFLYLGDTARFPFGDKTPEQLRACALEIAEHLLQAGAKLLVVACGSATAAALPLLRAHLSADRSDAGVLGVIAPAAELARDASASGRIGLLATPATVASGAFADAIGPGVELTAVPCPDLAPIIQAGFPFDERVVDTVRRYVAPLRAAQVDTVILGSTHYPLVAPMLQRMLGRDVTLVSSGAGVARAVERALAERDLLRDDQAVEGAYRFHCTGDVEAFRALGTRFLQMPLGDVEHVTLTPVEVAA